MIYKVKLAFLGEFGVGKSSILNTLQNKKDYCIQSTLGVDFIIRNFDLENNTYKLHIWDTAGQERFRSIVKSYFRDLDVAVLVYDCTDMYALDNLPKWDTDLDYINKEKNCVKFLVANKIDSKHRIINSEAGKEKANELNYHYFETSSLQKETVDNLFDNILHILNEKRVENKMNLEFHYENFNNKKSSNMIERKKIWCCNIL